jgi:hypothetical protein
MFTRFPRIVSAVLFSLLLLVWLYNSESSNLHRKVQFQITDHVPVTPDANPDQEQPIHLADRPDSFTAPPEPNVPVPTNSPVLSRISPYGYVFYATSDEYACSALIGLKRLREFRTHNRLYALLTDNVAKGYKEEMESINVTVSIHKPPAHPRPRSHHAENRMENTLMKLYAFRMHQLDATLRRVLVLDADTYIYKSLDTVFHLPDVDVAAPRAYWKGRDVLSSAFMLITLSDRLWRDIEGGIKTLAAGEYDQDLINNLFGSTAMVLPGQYLVPDKHWAYWDIPAWFRPEGSIFGNGMVSEYSKAKLDELWRVININVGAAPDEPANANKQKRSLVKREQGEKPGTEDDLGEILTPEQAAQELGVPVAAQVGM